MMNVEDGTSLGAKHYQGKGDQPIEIMQSKMTHEQFIGFLRGNVIKYVLRIGCKDDDIKDAQKAAQYATWLSKALKCETINPMGDIELIKKEDENCSTCKYNDSTHRYVCHNCQGFQRWEPKNKHQGKGCTKCDNFVNGVYCKAGIDHYQEECAKWKQKER